jgi:hypothetical protein
MANVEDYLKANSNLNQDDSALTTDTDGIRLDVVVSAISPKFVKFNHMGTEYRIDRQDVLDIEGRDDSSVAGNAATMTIKRDAEFLATYSVSAADVTSALPFSMTRAPVAPLRPIAPSAREAAWRLATGYSFPMVAAAIGAGGFPSLEKFLTPFQTLSGSPSQSNGIDDDTIPDDERTDY